MHLIDLKKKKKKKKKKIMYNVFRIFTINIWSTYTREIKFTIFLFLQINVKEHQNNCVLDRQQIFFQIFKSPLSEISNKFIKSTNVTF